MLLARTGFLMLPMKIEFFDIVNENWIFNVVNKN